MSRMRVIICSKCHLTGDDPDHPPMPERDGGKLLTYIKQQVKNEGLAEAIHVVGSRCLGCCDVNRMCGAVMETPGKDTQVLGGFKGAKDADILMAFIKAHLATRKRLRTKVVFPDHPEWADYFLIRIPGRHPTAVKDEEA